ncbi:MAG: hypothetical protein ACE37M_03410 [Henriciella sp.]
MIRLIATLALTASSPSLAIAQEFSTPFGPKAQATITYTVDVVPATTLIQVTGLEDFDFDFNVGADADLSKSIDLCVYTNQDNTPFSFIITAHPLSDGTNHFHYIYTLESAKDQRVGRNIYHSLHPNGRTSVEENRQTYSTTVGCPNPDDRTKFTVAFDSVPTIETSGATAEIIIAVAPD